MTAGVPHVERCKETSYWGGLAHGRTWQCRLGDPHPDVPHTYGIDAEEFGRDLDEQRPEWLAATLRDRVARGRHTQAQLEKVQAVLIDVLLGYATGKGVTADTIRWVHANAPDIASQLGWEQVQ